MKIIKQQKERNNNIVKDVKTEKYILQHLRHPFLITLFYAFQEGAKLNLIFELANGGDLFNHIQKEGKLPEDHCKFYAAEILGALEFLHNNNIVYRGLKPEDVLLDKEGHIKLSDFGLAKTKEAITSTFGGSPLYVAPETISGKKQTFAIDWWSFGVLIYEMLNGEPPFLSGSIRNILSEIVKNKLSFPEYFSEEATDLINKLLNSDPKSRLGSGKWGVAEIKTHPFFEDIDWDKVEAKRLIPPFIPLIKSDSDIGNYDKLFANMDRFPSQSKMPSGDVTESNFYFNAFHERQSKFISEHDLDSSSPNFPQSKDQGIIPTPSPLSTDSKLIDHSINQ